MVVPAAVGGEDGASVRCGDEREGILGLFLEMRQRKLEFINMV